MFLKIKNNIPILIFTIVFIVGILITLYPTISNLINTSKYTNVIYKYNEESDNMSKEKIEQLLMQAYKYNNSLSKTSIYDVFLNSKVKTNTDYDNLLNFDNTGIIGYISIPKINIRLPIYHGIKEDVLNKGVGHLEGSSLPIGGIGTHAVLAAHRGLPSSRLFTDLDKLEIGDIFNIYVFDYKLVYQVDKVTVVEPNDLHELELDYENDFVTLLTCTPYGINTHRLLVRGARIEDVSISDVANSVPLSLMDLILLIFSLLASFIMMKIIRKLWLKSSYDS